jgi:pyruvate kinase
MDQIFATKYIVTIGPNSANPETMENLIKAGANIFRCNFVHMSYDMYRDIHHHLLEINARLGTNTQLQADLQGLSIRLGDLPGKAETIFLKEGQEYVFATTGGEIKEDEIIINDSELQKYVKAGQDISFMNGAIEGEIVGVVDNRLYVKMINSGHLRPHKSVNLPESDLDTTMTEKDSRDLDFLVEEGVDWIALSFVSSKEELSELRKRLKGKPIHLISKIERRLAIENIDEIVVASDAVMVARGDLGIELPMQEVPIVQKMLISLCHHEKKPVIVATQMLLSMTHAKRPTRAEVSDVANAVFDHADAVMLSEETAEGDDPVNALSTMVTIVKRVEEYLYKEPNLFDQYQG